MFCSRPIHRRPPANPAPIRSAADALDLLARAVSHPLRPETIAFLLDDAGYGGTIVVVAGTDRPEQLLDVVEHLAGAGATHELAASMVVATVRPRGGIEPGDIDRWLDASDIVNDQGLRLIEWFVLGVDGFACPWDLLGEPERWSR